MEKVKHVISSVQSRQFKVLFLYLYSEIYTELDCSPTQLASKQLMFLVSSDCNPAQLGVCTNTPLCENERFGNQATVRAKYLPLFSVME